MFAKLLTFFVVVGLCDSAFGCNGYKARIIESVNCAGAQSALEVSKNPEFQIGFNEHCELIPSGCFDTIGFETARGKIRLEKRNKLIQEEPLDLCKSGGCSNNNDKYCPKHALMDLYDIRVLLFNYRSPFDLTLEADLNTGKACLKFKLEMYK